MVLRHCLEIMSESRKKKSPSRVNLRRDAASAGSAGPSGALTAPSDRASTPSSTQASTPSATQSGTFPQGSVELTDYLNRLTNNFLWQDRLPEPDDLERLRSELFADLVDVPVILKDGTAANVFQKIDADDFLSREDKELVWNCLAMVRRMFWVLEQTETQRGYQWNMNWKHTRAELDQVYDAAKILKLTPKETRDALIASIFSDAIKSRGNFIIHNVHGAQAAVMVLSYFLDAGKSTVRKSMERIERATKEHQIAPPEFMATVVAIMLHHKHRLKRFDPEGPSNSGTKPRTIYGIYQKIKDPFNLAHLNEARDLIDFHESERTLLKTIGIEEWYVPHPANPDARIAHAVIAGDHSINYNHPEGFAKIALLRGPDTESIFEDPTIHHSLESAVQSFADSFKVIRPEVQGLALKGLRRTKTAVERVITVMVELFNGITVGPKPDTFCGHTAIETAIDRAHDKHPELYTAEACALSDHGSTQVERALVRVGTIMDDWYKTHKNIPFNPKVSDFDEPGPGKLPFWNCPLKYPGRNDDGSLDLESLTELELKQFLFAEKIREIVVELLRAEQWIFAVDQD